MLRDYSNIENSGVSTKDIDVIAEWQSLLIN